MVKSTKRELYQARSRMIDFYFEEEKLDELDEFNPFEDEAEFQAVMNSEFIFMFLDEVGEDCNTEMLVLMEKQEILE
jgi:hypothetical protein